MTCIDVSTFATRARKSSRRTKRSSLISSVRKQNARAVCGTAACGSNLSLSEDNDMHEYITDLVALVLAFAVAARRKD